MTAALQAPDVDQVAVERAIHGHPVTLTDAERDEAVRRLTAAGRSAAHIGALLGITARHVCRIRAQLRIRGTDQGGSWR
jgi:hypothetical protein